MNNKKLVYISHPSSGKQENTDRVTKILTGLCSDKDITDKYCFVSPIHNYGSMYNMLNYETGLNLCLDLLAKCDIMLLCGDWESSRGCNIEYKFCQENNIQIIRVDDRHLEEILQAHNLFV